MTRKVKYVGQLDEVIVMLPGNHVVVKYGDVIPVPDDFNNANFEDVKDVVEEEKPSTKVNK